MQTRWGPWIMAGLLLLVGGLVIYPLTMVLFGSLWSGPPGVPGHFTIGGYIQAYSDSSIPLALGTTIWLGVLRTLIGATIAILFSWLLARTDLPYKGSIEILLWFYYFLPTMPMVMGWILLLSPHYGIVNQALMKLPFIDGPIFNIFSFAGIIWVHIPHGVASRVIMMTPAFLRMDAALEESARMSGSGNFATIFRITVPLLMPAILGATLLGLIKSLESFEAELLLGAPIGVYVFTTKIYDLISFTPPQYPASMALCAVFLVMIFGLIFLYRRTIGKREYVTVTGRGFATRPMALRHWKWPIFTVVALWIVISTLLPFAMLALGTFMKYFGLFLGDFLTLEHWRKVMGHPVLLTAAKNTLLLALITSVGGVILYTLISYVTVRTRFKGRGLLDFWTWLPWSVPGMVLALAILWAYVGGMAWLPFTLYGSLWLMAIAIIVKEFPMGMRLLNGVMVQIGKELEESAWVHGGSWLYSFRRVLVPLISPALMATTVILFLHGLRELSTVVLLYTPKSRVLSTLMLDFWLGDATGRAMVVGLMISLGVIMLSVAMRVMGVRQGAR